MPSRGLCCPTTTSARTSTARSSTSGSAPIPGALHKNGDTTGKFALNVDKKVYNCFVCGGGSLLSLVMAIQDLDVEAAIDWLLPLADDTSKTDDQWMDDIDRLLAKLPGSSATIEEALPYFNPHMLSKWDVYAENLRLWNEGEFDGKPKLIDWTSCSRRRLRPRHAVKYAPRDRDGSPWTSPTTGPA
jgi:hypothetical protein